MMNLCSHPGFFGSLCTKCGKVMDDDDSAVPFRYVHKNLRLSKEEVARLRNKDQDKKLYLVLDLDHTLLNSTGLQKMTTDEKYLMSGANSRLQGSLFMWNTTRMTKLRPFVHTFLKEASEMFEMYIYTMGSRFYASEMVKLLDPKSEYFISRVISRDESTRKHLKDLDLVLGKTSAILILDDTENLLKTLRKKVLKSCIVVFSSNVSKKFPLAKHQKMAKELGATCSTIADLSVTHVVSTDINTEAALWAVKENKFLVHPQWIEAASYLWEKQPEEKFSINKNL